MQFLSETSMAVPANSPNPSHGTIFGSIFLYTEPLVSQNILLMYMRATLLVDLFIKIFVNGDCELTIQIPTNTFNRNYSSTGLFPFGTVQNSILTATIEFEC
jgi:hypothetical protein